MTHVFLVISQLVCLGVVVTGPQHYVGKGLLGSLGVLLITLLFGGPLGLILTLEIVIIGGGALRAMMVVHAPEPRPKGMRPQAAWERQHPIDDDGEQQPGPEPDPDPVPNVDHAVAHIPARANLDDAPDDGAEEPVDPDQAQDPLPEPQPNQLWPAQDAFDDD